MARPRRSSPSAPDVGERHSSVRIEKMAAGGDGLGHLADGRVVFVAGAFTDELVTLSLTASKKDFARATAIAVEEASEHRVAPPCQAVAAGCGGCGWQHITPDYQSALKVDIVRDALRRTARRTGDSVTFGGAVPPWAYRTSARLAVGADGRVGFRASGSHRVVHHGACDVLHPGLAALLPTLRLSGSEEVSIRIGASSGERSLLASGTAARVSGCPADVGRGAAAVVHECVADAVLRVSAASFFQSGPAAAELLVSTVRDLAGADAEAPGVIDAYGGVGLFSAGLGLHRPVVVESSASSCADAAVNLREAGAQICNTTVEAWEPQRSPLVIADPARAGLGSAAVAVLAATEASTLVLVSCDPVAFARDVVLLTAVGFELAEVRVLDLFPHTSHVEVVSRFARSGSVT
jgi:23S rRNA (uracil1939-C5)-methyltransferase